MPHYRFFLNINGRRIEDHHGRVLPDLHTAILMARQEFPRLSRLAAADNGASLKIEVRDVNGTLLELIEDVIDMRKMG